MSGRGAEGVLVESSRAFRREIDALPAVFDLVGTFFSEASIGDGKGRFAVELALEEIFTNLIKYNPRGRSDIIVRLTLDGDELEVTVIDSDSAGFDLRTDAPEVDVTLPLEKRTPGGLGVQLVKKLVDRIDYTYDAPAGTVTLYKRVR